MTTPSEKGKVYVIKPLEWDGKLTEEFDSMRAGTPFGSYSITMREGGSLHWGYCFDEYYDEDDSECDSIEDGKQKAEAHWIERVSRALKVVTLPTGDKREGEG